MKHGQSIAENGQLFSKGQERAVNDALGMTWWNRLSDTDRKKWMQAAGNTGRAVNAWKAFQSASELSS